MSTDIFPAAIHDLDASILLFVQEHLRSPLLSSVLVFISRLGDKGLFWFVVIALLLIFRKTRQGGLITFTALAAEFVACDVIIKHLLMRPRPYLVISELICLVPPETSTSFPSGHSASSFVCAYVLCRLYGKKGAWAFLPATLIALSRIYVGVHYPSDVVCGIVLGLVVGVVVYAFWQKILLPWWDRRQSKAES